MKRLIKLSLTIGFCWLSTFAIANTDTMTAEAKKIARQYLAAIDTGNYALAYSMQTENLNAMMPFEQWRATTAATQALLGEFQVYGDVKITWYDNPENAALPGIYAAFDLKCRYDNTAICTKVLILHSATGENFQIMRHEINFVDHESFQKMQESRQGT